MKEGDVVIVYQNLSHSLELLFLNVIVILMCRKVDLKGPKILQLQVQCYLFYDKIYLLFLITCLDFTTCLLVERGLALLA